MKVTKYWTPLDDLSRINFDTILENGFRPNSISKKLAAKVRFVSSYIL